MPLCARAIDSSRNGRGGHTAAVHIVSADFFDDYSVVSLLFTPAPPLHPAINKSVVHMRSIRKFIKYLTVGLSPRARIDKQFTNNNNNRTQTSRGQYARNEKRLYGFHQRASARLPPPVAQLLLFNYNNIRCANNNHHRPRLYISINYHCTIFRG